MSEALEVRTSHRDVSDVVRELAPFVDDLSLRLPSGRRISDGDWVRFSVHLIDGSAVLEGVGRCQGSTQEGASTFRVRLSLLSFDARNEVMYERILLARDFESEEVTGTIDLRGMGDKILKQPPTPPTRSALPPPSPGARLRPSTRSPPPLPGKSAPPATQLSERPTRPPPQSRIPKAPRPPSTGAMARPRKRVGAEPRARSKALPRGDTRVEARPVPAPKTDRPPRRSEAAPPKARQHAALAPTEERTSPSLQLPLGESPTTDTAISTGAALTQLDTHSGLRLDIPSRLVERARALAPTLPPGLATATPARETEEEAVLRVALRIGLASLAALSDADDEP